MTSPQSKLTLTVDAVSSVDRLERSRFTRYLLDVLLQIDAGQGAVVGLEGAWGSGKTWVLRQLVALAQGDNETQQPVFIEFNPWMVSGTNDLVVALLSQLSRQLAEQGSKASTGGGRAMVSKATKAIDKYASALVAIKHVSPVLNMLIPGAGIVVGGIATAAESAASAARAVIPALPQQASKKSLVALRSDIERALKALSRKIVVIVDDLDRIAPAEVASMVQTIKAVADFPDVIYVISYARSTIAHALKTNLGVDDGFAFLEKVVQIEVELPPAPARRLQALAVTQIRQTLVGVTALGADQQKDWELALPIAASLMQSPRDIARLHTRLSIVLPLMVNEVNVADVAVAEAIRLKVPSFVPWLDNHPGLVTELGIARDDSSLEARHFSHLDEPVLGANKEENDKNREMRLQELNTLYKSTLALAGPYRRALRFLFNATRDWSFEADRSNCRRLQRFRHWYRWRCLCDHQEPLSTDEVQQLARQPQLARQKGWLDSRDAFTELCMHFCDLAEDDLGSADACGWLDLLEQAQQLWGPEFVINWGLGFGPAAALVASLQLDPKGRDAVIEALVNSGSLAIAGSLLLFLKREQDEGPRERKIDVSDATARQLSTRWYERMDAALAGDPPLAVDGDLCAYAYCCWMQSHGRHEREIKDLAIRLIGDDESQLSSFFACLSDRTTHAQFGLKVHWALLPPTSRLRALADRSTAFQQTHSQFCEQLNRQPGLPEPSAQA